MKSASFREKYGPWAIVTGASSGIGRELARQLAREQLSLVLVARREAALEELAAELLSTNRSIAIRALPLDLSTKEASAALDRETRDLEVGMLVASAGFGTSGKFLESSLENELAMLSVNCAALTSQVHAFGQRFARQGRGGILLLSSIVGFQGMPFAAHYAATKAYVQTLAEALHVEFASSGVDILASAPGPTDTEFAERAGMVMGTTLDASQVAQASLAALGRKATVLPGFLSKLLRYSLVPLPRWARIRIMGKVMKGMIPPSAPVDSRTQPALSSS